MSSGLLFHLHSVKVCAQLFWFMLSREVGNGCIRSVLNY
jgi:hypothetical protein